MERSSTEDVRYWDCWSEYGNIDLHKGDLSTDTEDGWRNFEGGTGMCNPWFTEKVKYYICNLKLRMNFEIFLMYNGYENIAFLIYHFSM